MREPESITVNEDARLIPVWSIVASIAAFVLVEYYFWMLLPEHQHHAPPIGLRIYFNLSCGLLAALYFLMVGYVSKDAVLDCDLPGDAGGDRRGAVLFAAPAGGFAVPGVLDACAE
jgi:hypothetical protein